MRYWLSPVALLVAIGLSACSALPPAAELERYRLASSAGLEGTRELAGVLSPAERRGAPKPGDPDQPRNILPFAPDEAGYYTTIGEPPLTAHILRAAEAIDGFNQLLLLYAEGRSWDLIAPRVDELAKSADTIVGLLSATSSAAPVAPIVGAGTAVFKSFASGLRRVGDRQSFRTMVMEDSAKLGAVIDHLRNDASPLVHMILQSDANRQASAALRTAPDGKAVLAAGEAKKRAYRELVANWVVLLDRTKRALAALETAVAMGGGDMAAGAFWAREAAEAAVHIRASILTLNQLRNGGL